MTKTLGKELPIRDVKNAKLGSAWKATNYPSLNAVKNTAYSIPFVKHGGKLKRGIDLSAKAADGKTIKSKDKVSGSVTLSARANGTIKYSIDGGETKTYTKPLEIDGKKTIRFSIASGYATDFVVDSSSKSPVLYGAANGGKYYVGRVISFEDGIFAQIEKDKNIWQINSGDLIKEPGSYKLTLTDTYGNKSITSFVIKDIGALKSISKETMSQIKRDIASIEQRYPKYAQEMKNKLKRFTRSKSNSAINQGGSKQGEDNSLKGDDYILLDEPGSEMQEEPAIDDETNLTNREFTISDAQSSQSNSSGGYPKGFGGEAALLVVAGGLMGKAKRGH